MTTLIFSAAVLLGLQLLLLLIFKTNAGVMFLAACAGLVLLSSLDPVVVTTAAAFVPQEGEAYVRLLVVLLSIVFSAMMFKNSVHGSKIFLHALLVVVTALMLWLLLPSATGVSWLLDNSKESIWQNVNDYRTLIVASGFSLSLLVVLMKSGHHSGHKSKH
jgi:hypothetical protein